MLNIIKYIFAVSLIINSKIDRFVYLYPEYAWKIKVTIWNDFIKSVYVSSGMIKPRLIWKDVVYFNKQELSSENNNLV